MGRVYTVPRSAKGESRILYIFSIKSFVVTIVFGVVGIITWIIVGKMVDLSIYAKIIITALFAVIGYFLSAVKIPDSPLMGPLQKAGGEVIGDMLVRLAFFSRNKKIYIYNKAREESLNKRGVIKK